MEALRTNIVLPPTINHYYRPDHHITKEVRVFRDHIWAQSIYEKWPRFHDERLAACVVWHFKTAAGDIDNRAKGLLDALQSPRKRSGRTAGICDNDSQFDLIVLRRGETHVQPHAELMVWPIESRLVTLGI